VAEEGKSKGGGGGLAWLIVLVLLGVVFWLGSERNARKWALSVEGDKLVVQRGRFFPTGMRTLGAGDGDLGKAYAPVQIPPNAKVAEAEFDDRVSLDRGLFDLLLPWAKEAAGKPDGASQKASMELADRASELPGLAPAQLDQLAQLRGDLAYAAAIGELQAASGLIESARRRLALSQQQGGSRSLQAGALAAELKTLGDRLADLTVGRAPTAALAAEVKAAQAATPKETPNAPDAGKPDAGAADAGR
jgi:hypothetical protein